MLVYLICYGISCFAAWKGLYYVSGLSLIGAAVYLYVREYLRSNNLVHLRALFSLFWVGGQGISCLKLSKLQTDWNLMTWLCFLAAFLGFWLTYEILCRTKGNPDREMRRWTNFQGMKRQLFHSMAAITIISVLCFLTEAVVLGYIPFFLRGVPHAYSQFHITGVHYFTISCVLVPSLSVIYFHTGSFFKRRENIMVISMDVVAILIPILCVSRFQLILAAFLAVLTYMCMDSRIGISYGIGAAVALIPVYILLTIARSHDITYLNGIFEMKNSQMPIFITQPYMYIANNYDNFNCLVEQLPNHTWGLRSLFPIWALTGLKFLKPSLVDFPIFVTKEELTTVTLFYDAFYDFGIVGVILFSCLLGMTAYYLVRMVKHLRNPIGYLFYAQIAMYFMLSFFTTWFSNPTTWFWLAVTGAVAVYTDRR